MGTTSDNISTWLSEFENGLSALKNSPQDSDVLNNLLKTTRNIKYASETLELNDIYKISRLLRNIEDMLRLIRHNKLNLSRKQIDALSKAVDLMFDMVNIVRGLMNNKEEAEGLIKSTVVNQYGQVLNELNSCINNAKNREEDISDISGKSEIKYEIGKRTKKLRESLVLSQAEFGRQIGVPFQHISRYERGEITPSAEMLIKIYECFNVSINWLLTGKGAMSIDSHGVSVKKNGIL